MDEGEKTKEAQEKLEWAIRHLSGSIKCKVIYHKYKSFRVQFFTKDSKLMMPVQIAEEEIGETNPKENSIPDKLKALLRNLENYQYRFELSQVAFHPDISYVSSRKRLPGCRSFSIGIVSQQRR